MASATALSRNDRNVLSALFDSEGMPSREVKTSTNPVLPGISTTQLRTLQAREVEALTSLNTNSPSTDQIQSSIEALSSIIRDAPMYAPAYNNRAQATRMLVGDDLTQPVASSSTLFADLCEAIRLSSPSSPEQGASSFQSKTLASAYTHRAHLCYKASKIVAKDPSKAQLLPRGLKSMDAARLEKLAAADFRQGGIYGNEIAKQMAIQLNPYAKMCGEIVREAMIADMRESGVIPVEQSIS